MSHQYRVDFATFCHRGDVHRLHEHGQFKRQVESNGYEFNEVLVIYQKHESEQFLFLACNYPVCIYTIFDFDEILETFGIDLSKSQYASQTDQAHYWKYHVVNHLKAISESSADYIVFADNDCWMVRQPEGKSWVDVGIKYLQSHPEIFIVSPSDGERQRMTQRFSQQMFLARVDEFRNAM
jgi:hypothetical protein